MTVFDTLFLDRAWPVLVATYGELVRYEPDAGDPRAFEAVVNVGTLDRDENQQSHNEDTAQVDCRRHDTLGITLPKKGERLFRTEVDGDDANPYVFTGEVLVATATLYRLKFTRPRLTRLGQR